MLCVQSLAVDLFDNFPVAHCLLLELVDPAVKLALHLSISKRCQILRHWASLASTRPACGSIIGVSG